LSQRDSCGPSANAPLQLFYLMRGPFFISGHLVECSTMKCVKCGKDNKKNELYCKFCGENLLATEQPLTLAFMLKSLFVIYTLIFLSYMLYLALEEPFQTFVNNLATK